MSKKMSAIIWISLCLFVWNPGYAEEGKGNNPGFPAGSQMSGDAQNRPPRPMNAGDLLGKALHDQMAAEVLTELTGKTVNAADAAEGKIRDVLESSGIGQDAFKNAMDAKTTPLFQKAVGCGLITETQASEMIQQITNGPKAIGPLTRK
jgi:hypothetical protein